MSLHKLSLALININTLNDKKLPLFNTCTFDDSISFITEVNADTPERVNSITYDESYEYHFIPKESDFSQRIAIRKKKGDKNVSITVLDHLYITQNRKQRDKSSCQIIYARIRISFLHFTTMLIYRCPDSDPETDNSMYDFINNYNPDTFLGDLNINLFEKKSIKDMHQRVPHRQIVKTGTRSECRRDRDASETLIDHFWVQPKLEHRFRAKVLDVSEYSITDHKLVRIETDLKITPAKITFTPELDRFRRYQSRPFMGGG